jgi:murein DD-endopeptidase MepM/ murein hydrolase activator NlpD
MNIEKRRGSILLALLISLIASLSLAKAPPFEIELYTRKLAPGEAVLIKIIPNVEIVSVSGSFIDEQLDFIEQGDSFIALSGIDLKTKPGEYSLRIDATLKNGFTLKRRVPITVREVSFPVEMLTVDPKFVRLSDEDLARVRKENELLRKVYAVSSPAPLWERKFIPPVESAVISPFGARRLFNGEPRSRHNGVDLRAALGTKIRAANSGKVVLARDLFFGGNTVIIDHGRDIITVYCHLSEIITAEGKMVEKGQVIGLAGMTGRVTGPHLHLSARVAGIRVDPLSLLFLPLD